MKTPPLRTRRTGGKTLLVTTLSSSNGRRAGFDLRVLCVLLRKCDGLLTPRTCPAAIAPMTMNAKAAKVAKLSTTCNRETRDQLSRGSGSLRDLSGLCVDPFCTREGREP